jgi:ribosomal-protein-alanine N-acetyltransferase
MDTNMSKQITRTIFETERLLVRKYNGADEDNFFSLNGNPLVMQYIRAVKTREESDAFLKEVISDSLIDPKRGRWAVEEKGTGRFIGSFAIIPMPGEEEKIQLGYSLAPHNWGMGYATELTLAGLSYFFSTNDLPIIYGITEIPNVASQNVLLKAGFKPSGKKMEDEKELLVFVAERQNK